MVHLLKSIAIVAVEGRQTLILIPAAFVKRFPKNYVGEYFELDVDRLLLRLVDPDAAQNTPYTVVRHHGSAQLSIPRFWLKDRAAVPGDAVEVWEDSAQPDRLLVRFSPKVSNPTAAAALNPPVYADFRMVGE